MEVDAQFELILDARLRRVGSTMDTLKGRMDGHCGDVRDFIRTGKRADSFESHFSMHVKRGDLSRLLVKNGVEKSRIYILSIYLIHAIVRDKQYDSTGTRRPRELKFGKCTEWE